MGTGHRLAAIDIGTVTTRLLVADVSSESIIEVGRSTDITQLGEGVTSSGRLSPEAIERVATVVRHYAATMAELGVERYSAFATSASRDAENGPDFVRRIESEGIALEIISGGREAELSFRGATAQRTGEGLLVVDCGGGSTELISGCVAVENGERTGRIDVARSIDVGSRRMTELFLHSDPPTRAELGAAGSWAASELRGYFARLDERPRELIGLAGTATSLAAIELGLATYDPARVHGFELSGSQLSDLLEMLAGSPAREAPPGGGTASGACGGHRGGHTHLRDRPGALGSGPHDRERARPPLWDTSGDLSRPAGIACRAQRKRGLAGGGTM